MSVATRAEGGLLALKTMWALRGEYQQVRFVVGLSNISFGLPARRLINRAFLTLAIAHGPDAAVMDPLDGGLFEELLAANLVLGYDDFCNNFTAAFRKGRIR